MKDLPLARRLMLLYKFTKNKSILDFKQECKIYEAYGNFVFGAVGSALDIDDIILLRGAGWAQKKAGTSKIKWGSYYSSFCFFKNRDDDSTCSYGDQPEDQEMIEYGIWYYREIYLKGKK